MPLSPDEIETYREEGLVIPRFSLSPDLLAALREDCERVIADNPDIRPEQLANVHFDKSSHRPEGVHGGDRIRGYGALPEILDMVEQLIGPDIILWASQIFAKPPAIGREVPWHQDGHYWPLRPLAAMTVWIALDDSTPENGCMRYIPGSHRSGILSHHLDERRDVALSQEIQSTLFDESLAKDDALQAGQLSLHDAFLIHGSRPNQSTKRRAGLTFRYMPTTTHWDRNVAPLPDPSGKPIANHRRTRPIYLVRGVNHHPGNDLTVGH
jgi:hypothetical protein